ncbi:hypothetical protein B0H12DRAFT_593049 [Mycena haematopus]|nr:hypothetical protein B0H12DRAFT_593049 [Mycena haematopus]
MIWWKNRRIRASSFDVMSKVCRISMPLRRWGYSRIQKSSGQSLSLERAKLVRSLSSCSSWIYKLLNAGPTSEWLCKSSGARRPQRAMLFGGKLACFSPSVDASLRSAWVNHGGAVTSSKQEFYRTDIFFCNGPHDLWLKE